MRSHAWCAGVLVVWAAGCKVDGPGFYGTVMLAGGNGQSAQRQADPALARQVVRVMLPPRMREGFNHLLEAARTARLPKRAPAPQRHAPLAEEWRAGEVMVRSPLSQRAHEGELHAALREVLSPGSEVRLRLCNDETICLWRVYGPDGKLLDGPQTRVAAERMQGARHVRWAVVNHVLHALAVPNDEYASLQWHYNLMNLPAAWDVTTGDPGVVVAVIDSGVSMSNADITGRLGQGADLISDAAIANDGDGRDDNPDDPGDEAAGGGSFHGTHVAGTVGAVTDNGVGVAGVSWSGRVLPIRALGIGGGTSFDIIAGMQWAMGTSVEGVSPNAFPADVLSMSLGGPGTSTAYQDIISEVVAAGALVVVAAGNDNVDANTFVPANVPQAITVGATNLGGGRASYSNWGSAVDIMAPGGEMAEDSDGDGYADGVLSTVRTSFDFLQGTSMAAPHIAGLAVLMKSLNRSISAADAEQLLRDTARGEYACTEGCGAGLVDAAAVVAQLGTNANQPFLSVSPASVFLPKDENTVAITVRNSGGAALHWTASFTDGGSLFTAAPADGDLAPRQSVTVNVAVAADRNATPFGEGTLVFTDGTQARSVHLVFNEALSRKKPQINEAVVGALVQNGEDLEVAKDENGESAVALAERDSDFKYKVQPLKAGDYLIVGITDDNNNGSWDDGEGVGLYPDLATPAFVTLQKDEKLGGVDFLIRPSFLGNGTTCPDNSTVDGQNCICNPGYRVSDDGKSCVAR
ncbi:MAG: S8 family serine peptidase [Deltaproteobacteria bacterium]|nr:S8 family serine peptidase [Deltaproteobacteria bacterium]